MNIAPYSFSPSKYKIHITWWFLNNVYLRFKTVFSYVFKLSKYFRNTLAYHINHLQPLWMLFWTMEPNFKETGAKLAKEFMCGIITYSLSGSIASFYWWRVGDTKRDNRRTGLKTYLLFYQHKKILALINYFL